MGFAVSGREEEGIERKAEIEHGCQMAIAGICMCLALQAFGLRLRYATLQNLIPSLPRIAPPRPPPWRNPRKGRNQILPSGNLGRESGFMMERLPSFFPFLR